MNQFKRKCIVYKYKYQIIHRWKYADSSPYPPSPEKEKNLTSR